MAKPALLFAFLLIAGASVAESTSELQRTRCSRDEETGGPAASVVVLTTTSEDEATVEFEFKQLDFSFTLSARSAFTSNGVVRTVGAAGSQRVRPRAQRVHTYWLREDDLHARAVITDGGRVRGLFGDARMVVYLEPSTSGVAPPPEGVLHDLYIMASNHSQTGANNSSQQIASSPSLRGSTLQSSSMNNVFESDGMIDPSWGGDRFWPGCYPGDNVMNSMKLRIYTDVQLYNENSAPGEVQAMVEAAIVQASYVYENQLNVELLVEELVMYTDEGTAPDWAKNCDANGQDSFIDYKFDRLFLENKEDVVSMQAFTGCGNGFGVVGVAWLGTTCNIFNGPNGVGRYNYGLNQMNTPSSWLTFAHELGHNLGADHAFDEGQGQTGGIMDYFVGGIHDGVIQFNVDYTKDELCSTFTGMGSRCPSDQWFQSPTTTTTPETSVTTTTTTTTPPTTTTTTTTTTTPTTTTTTTPSTTTTTTPTTTTTTVATTTTTTTTPTTTTTVTTTTTIPTTTTTTVATTTTTITTTTTPSTTTATTATTTTTTQTATTTTTTAPTTTTTTTTTTPATTPATTTTATTTTTASATTTTQVPGGWQITSGNCVRDAEEPKCIQSPNYPNEYPDGQRCKISIIETTAPISVDSFNVRFKDWMRVNGVKYRGTTGPDGVVPTGEILWKSNNDGKVRPGWRMCREV